MQERIWTEKYRPKTFNELVGQVEIVKRIKAMIEKKNLTNLLFTGPAGVGKTSLILVAARELYGDSWKQNILNLNASDDRGIDIIRNEVKDFARTKSLSDVPFKICILDEADSLTKEAQQALRRTMEDFSNTCRFCLISNYATKIIDPIQSRCTVFRFKPLTKEDVENVIRKITTEEKIKLDKNVIEVLYNISEGDLRKLENIMQSCCSIGNEINEKVIYEVISEAKPKDVIEVLKLANQGSFVKAREKLIEVMLQNGLSGLDVIKHIQKEIWNLSNSDENKMHLIEKCGEVEFRMVEGSDEFVQLEALLAAFVNKK